jgi:hypothetical protein
MDNAVFMEAVRSHCSSKGISIADLARSINIPRGTVSGWANKGIQNDKAREKIVEKYPQIFGGGKPAAASLGSVLSGAGSLDFKIEAARASVGYLSGLLEWFLYIATREERNRFRDELGNQWKHFLELTRGMTSEAAFDVAKSERRL